MKAVKRPIPIDVVRFDQHDLMGLPDCVTVTLHDDGRYTVRNQPVVESTR